ncbi:unnamed protein product, partial [Brassica oleracea var. botrytis]
LLQTRVINFVQKDIGEMFPKWEFDVEDTPAENIIKLMFVKKPWKWTMDCWEVTGTWFNTKPAVVKRFIRLSKAAAVASEEAAAEASEEVHTTVGGLTKEDIKTMFKDIVDAMREGFGTCLKEIKYLSERVEAVEKKSESVNGTNAGRKSLPEDKGPDVPADASFSKDKAPEPSLVLLDKNQSTVSDLQKEDARYLEKRDAALALCRAKSDRTRKLAASQQSPYTANNTAKVIIPNKKLYPGYNPFAPIDKKKLKELADYHYRIPLDKKPCTSKTWWYQILWTSLEWLEDCHIDAWINVLRQRYQENPQAFRSERMCFLDHNFSQSWREQYQLFKTSEPDHKGLGRVLPVNLDDKHWVAIWISIPKRHIVVWDSIPSSSVPDAWDAIMEPFLQMVPYLLVECAATDEIRVKYGLEPYTYERPLKGVPTANNGDCGVYAVKYIECHALGVSFDPKDFARCNAKKMRDNMAVDIWKELVDQHLKENVDGDKFVGMYD